MEGVVGQFELVTGNQGDDISCREEASGPRTACAEPGSCEARERQEVRPGLPVS